MNYLLSLCTPCRLQATHQGMSTVMRTMLRAADLLLADPAATVNTSNPNIAFLFQVRTS